MPISKEETFKKFEKLVQRALPESTKNGTNMRYGIVREILSGTNRINVEVVSTGELIKNLPSNQGAIPSIGDKVIIFSPDSKNLSQNFATVFNTNPSATPMIKIRAFNNSTQSSGNIGVSVKLQFPSKTFDPGGNFDNITNYRFTVPTGYDGYYSILSRVGIIEGTASKVDHQLTVAKNGGLVSAGSNFVNITYPALFLADVLALNAGDYLEAFINTGGGGVSVQVQAGTANTFIAVTYLGSFF